jgi:hypothetical protein
MLGFWRILGVGVRVVVMAVVVMAVVVMAVVVMAVVVMAVVVMAVVVTEIELVVAKGNMDGVGGEVVEEELLEIMVARTQRPEQSQKPVSTAQISYPLYFAP